MTTTRLDGGLSAQPRRLRGLIMAAIATAISLAILVSLGLWQLDRLAWKEGVIARIEARAHAAPVALPPPAQWAALDPAEYEYRRVLVEGRFRHADEARVHGLMPSRTRGQPVQGFYLMTPLETDEGATVLVNRGFVPTELVAEADRPEGRAAIVGLMRPSEIRTAFVPENRPESDVWFTRDLPAIAQARGIEGVAPFFVDAVLDESGPMWPRGGASVLEPSNNHLQYALTWFSLAGVLAVVFVLFAARTLAEPRRGGGS